MDALGLILLPLVAAVAGGTTLAVWVESGSLAALGSPSGRRARLAPGLAAGIPLGIALLGLLGFAGASLLGMDAGTVVACVLLSVPAGFAVRAGQRRVLGLAAQVPAATERAAGAAGASGASGSAGATGAAGATGTSGAAATRAARASSGWSRARRGACWLLAALALGSVFDRVLLERHGGLATGNDHNLGDLPFHLAIITGFAQGENIPPEHPELAGVRLTYPFLVDFVAAQLVRCGASLRQALLLENLPLAVSLALLLYRLGLALTRDPRGALATPLLVFLSGGAGILMLLREGAPDLLRLRHDYTITFSGELRWGNALVALLVPQRSLLLGAPLAVWVLLLLWRALAPSCPEPVRRRLLLGAGLVTGLTPLVHAHATLVLLAMAAGLAWLHRERSASTRAERLGLSRAWLGFLLGAAVLAAPQVAWMAAGSGIRPGGFLGWHVGWDHGGRNPLLFWLSNTGLFLPVLLVAVFAAPPRLRRFWLPFLALFVLPNLLRLSPWIWDNIKFLFFWFLASVPLVALLLARLSRRGVAGASLAALLGVALAASGGLDVWRMASGQIEHTIFAADAVAFAREVLSSVPAKARLVQAPAYDSPAYLAGRRVLLGYVGHIGSQGLDAGDREDAVRRIYAGAPDASALLARFQVDYVLVGPRERSELRADEDFLARLPLVGERGRYRLHRAR